MNFKFTFSAICILFLTCFAYSQNSLELNNYVLVQGGTFTMGLNSTYASDPEHEVTVSDFYISKYEVTVADFKRFVDETGYITDIENKDEKTYTVGIVHPSGIAPNSKWKPVNWRHNPKGELIKADDYNHPVIFITYNDAMAYCKWLSKKLKRECRLPTEAEWEFAAGSRGKYRRFCWGNELPKEKKVANISDLSAKYRWPEQDWFYHGEHNDGYDLTSPVGSFPPNELGLYDMCGNVHEFCSDFYDQHYYSKSPKLNPQGPKTGQPAPVKNVISKSARGGSYFGFPIHANVFGRSYYGLDEVSHDLGFRVCISAK